MVEKWVIVKYSMGFSFMDLVIIFGLSKVFFNTSCKLEEEDYAEAKRALVDGLESSQIREFGLPVRPSFCRPVKKTARALGKALFNAELGKPIGQIIIICGRNKILASTLETSPWKVPLKRIRGQKWRNGWVL